MYRIFREGRDHMIVNEEGHFFTGYDFMGSSNWTEKASEAYRTEPEEALQIKSDLEAAEGIQHFSFETLCATMGLKPEVMQSYHGGPVPQEAYLK